MKFGLLSYDYTINLGNEVQSIAARRFLPKIDYYIEQHKIQEFNRDTDVKTIMNAWYLNCPEAWPPSRNIDPLLISMHFASNDFTHDVILSKESKEYLKEYGPVGCRDEFSANLLNDNGIDAYFSGCMSLTLDSGNKYNQLDEGNEYILINCDNSQELISYLKDKTDKKIYSFYQDFAPSFKKAWLGQIPKSLYNHTSYWNSEEKFFLAENLLRMYENASCVITDRLHCALPTLALKTPVLLFNTRSKQDRFEGLYDLFVVSNMKEYEKNFSIFNVNDPPENSNEYLPLRKELIKKCRKFTNYMDDTCYKTKTYNELLDKNLLMFSKQAQDTRKYIVDVLNMSENYEKKLSKQKKTINEQEKNIKNQQKTINDQEKIIKEQARIISEFKNSNSWKLTGPLRKLKKL